MSLADIYTLGVEIHGDISSLRKELAEGRRLTAEFASSTVEALNRAAAALERSAGSMESGARRTRRASEQTQKATKDAGRGFEEYMARATRANEQVASSSEETSRRTTTALGGLGATLGRLTGAAGMGFLAKQVWDVGVGFHEFTQNTQVALELFLGSQEAAKGFLAEVLEFAKQTPYAFTDLTDHAKQLLTYGFQAEEVIPILRAVGDAATGMGTGAVGMERIIRALGQINTKGRLQSQELLQLSEAGVNGLAILANQANMTTLEYQKLIERGLVGADEAIRGLTQGIREGTEGINGQTTAFGGLMAQIKGSGGLTATVDSTRSAFRNAAAEVTESLVPAFTSAMRGTQDVLGVVRDVAAGFNDLPAPVRNAALAFGAAAAAARLLNVEGRATAAWAGFRTAIQTARVQVDLLTTSTSRARAVLAVTGATVRGLGTALLGAFGGPVGLAIAGAAAALAAYSSAQAEATARAQEYQATIDATTGAITAQTNQLIAQKIATSDVAQATLFGFTTVSDALTDMADTMGVSMQELVGYIRGESDAIDSVTAKTREYVNAQGWWSRNVLQTRQVQVKSFIDLLERERTGLERGTQAAQSYQQAQETIAAAVDEEAAALQRANRYLVEFTDEQVKAVQKAQDAARNALGTTLGGLKLDVTTEDDLATARERVEDATRRVRDAEADRAALASKEQVAAEDRIRAEEAVADARKALQKATDELATVESKTNPAEVYRRQVEEMIAANETFLADIQTLAERGLNAIDLQEIINKGPEGSLDMRRALLGDPDMIDFTNAARETLQEQANAIASQASVVELALQDTGGELMADLALGMKLATSQGATDTLEELAKQLGSSPRKLRILGNQLGLEFVNGFSDALGFDISLFFAERNPNRGGAGGRMLAYASGGIYPGYTPGRDIGLIAVSGGEAIMRPEWTRAVGPTLIDRWNRIARTGGVDAVRSEMRRFLGGFAQGGVVPSPQVVTVPVTSRNEHYSPIHVDTVIAADVEDFTRQALLRRRRDRIGGIRG